MKFSPLSVCGVNLGTSMDGTSPTLLSPQHISNSPAPNLSLAPPPSLPPPPPPPPPSHVPPVSAVELSTTNIPSCSSPLSPLPSPPPPSSSIYSQTNTTTSISSLAPLQHPVSPKTNRLQYCLPQSYGEIHKELSAAIPNGSVSSNMEEIFLHAHKRTRIMPPMSERIVIYVRRDGEDSYTPLHIVPPTTLGLLNAIEQKFQIPRTSIKTLFRKNNKAGIRAKLDDDLLRYYCNEDWFIIDIQRTDQDSFDITLIQLPE
ncbi:UNVERIFIED_CONTAM: hypothetical protein RMT77_019483 [Armadillidium vulgare]